MYRKLNRISWATLAVSCCISAPICSGAQDIFVGHYINPGDVGQFSNSGAPVRALTTGSPFQPYGITFGPDGLLYATDTHHAYIDKFNPSTGQIVGTVGPTMAGQLAFGPDGFLYANSNNTIFKINTATNSQQALFSLNFIGGGMAFRPDNGD